MMSLPPHTALTAPACDPFTINRMSHIDLGAGFLHDMFSHIDLFCQQITLAQSQSPPERYDLQWGSGFAVIPSPCLNGCLCTTDSTNTPWSYDNTVPRCSTFEWARLTAAYQITSRAYILANKSL